VPFPPKSAPTYEDVVRYFESLIDYEKAGRSRFRSETREADLERFRTLLAALGSPQFSAPAFHVAGTKGKGSTCALLASMLHHAGLHVGLYTSPHIESYCERLRIDGTPVPPDTFARLITGIAARLPTAPGAQQTDFRTVFELLTAAGFAFFADNGVDAMVIETGLGGRLDATNVFAPPWRPEGHVLINVITVIGLDHTEILGETPEAIAREKAGIIQPEATVVVAEQSPTCAEAVRHVIVRRAADVGVRGVYFADELIEVLPVNGADSADAGPPHATRGLFRLTPQGRELFHDTALGETLRDGLPLEVGLLGLHQLSNARTALVALLAAQRDMGAEFHPAAIAEGARHVQWPGRFQVLSTAPPIVVDGAHCELSARAMAATYRSLWGSRPARVVIGVMQDKNLGRILDALALHLPAVRFYCCAPPSPRGFGAEATAAMVRDKLHIEAFPFGSPSDAVRAAWHDLDVARESLVCFGSFYLVAPYEKIIRELLSADGQSPQR
jgi:dihydrofolate synthase/folylpolyglutamate synthase